MKAIEFPEQTKVFAKDQPEYMPLPAWINPDANSMGEVVSKWKFSEKELQECINNGGEFYITVCTFHGRRRITLDELIQAIDTVDEKTGFGVINTGGLQPLRPDAFSPFEHHPDKE